MQRPQIDPITAEVLRSAIHDLAGPATRLGLLTQLLERSGVALDEDTRKVLGYVEDSATAVGVVADGLRKYLEVCSRPLARVPLALDLALTAAVSNIAAEAEQAGAAITRSALPQVQADLFQMTWLFQELLTNAIRFRAEAAPAIHISPGDGGPGGWFISVADNGPGISSDMAERAFRPFKKLSGGGGAGLGLTICRKIIELHDGQVWLEPRDSGADFRFFTGGVRTGNDT